MYMLKIGSFVYMNKNDFILVKVELQCLWQMMKIGLYGFIIHERQMLKIICLSGSKDKIKMR